MLARPSGVQAFMAFATDRAYRASLGHRTAALDDSRLLPPIERPRTHGDDHGA